MGSVKLKTIRLWEHRMVRWMAAYSSGLSAKDSQKRVKEFTSRKYTSHRRVPKILALNILFGTVAKSGKYQN